MATSNIKRVSLRVRCTEGIIYETPTTEVTEDQYKQFEELLKGMKKLNFFIIENQFGDDVHINPDKIIAVEVLKDKGF